jgi:hypothetical protein
VDSPGSGQGPVADSSKQSDEPSGYGATESVIGEGGGLNKRFWTNLISARICSMQHPIKNKIKLKKTAEGAKY